MFFLLLCLCRAVFIVVVDGTGVFPRNSFSFSNAVILAALWKRSNQMPKLLQQCSSVHSCFKNTRVHQAYKNRCMQLSVPSQEEPFISTILRSYCVNTWVQRCVLLFNQKAKHMRFVLSHLELLQAACVWHRFVHMFHLNWTHVTVESLCLSCIIITFQSQS